MDELIFYLIEELKKFLEITRHAEKVNSDHEDIGLYLNHENQPNTIQYVMAAEYIVYNLLERLNNIIERLKDTNDSSYKLPNINFLGNFDYRDIKGFLKKIHEDIQINKEICEWIYFAQGYISKEYINIPLFPPHLYAKSNLILRSSIDPQKCHKDLEFIRNHLIYYKNILDKYEYDLSKCLIITSVPIEYISIFRKIKFFLKASNDFYYRISESNRIFTWFDAIIERKNKISKITVLFLGKEYGSLAACDGIHEYVKQSNNKLKYFKEIILLGIAGHLDKKNEIGIGDLIISKGFYNAYEGRKIEDSNWYFSKNALIDLHENYGDFFKIQLSKWHPKLILAIPPELKENNCKAKFGYFVSGAEVVKDTKYKQIFQNYFPNCLAVEMEAVGCIKAIKGTSPFTIIKCICDLSITPKLKKWQPYCADVATEFVIDHIISKYGIDIE